MGEGNGGPVLNRYLVDKDNLPNEFPTHRHDPKFWEFLGRTVATFGFLEEVLGKAIFAFTATRPYNETEIQAVFTEWLKKLERALSDPLGKLIGAFEDAVREHPSSTLENLNDLIADLRKAAELRNVLCHGSWRLPDKNGASIPFFVTPKMRVFDSAIDLEFLVQTQKHIAELACEVVNCVTHMGLQFPGTAGPGQSFRI